VNEVAGLTPDQIEVIVGVTVLQLLIASSVAYIVVRRMKAFHRGQANNEYEQWKQYLKNEYARILAETLVNQQEIQVLVTELRNVAKLLRESSGKTDQALQDAIDMLPDDALSPQDALDEAISAAVHRVDEI
jgi:hypothetical protein